MTGQFGKLNSNEDTKRLTEKSKEGIISYPVSSSEATLNVNMDDAQSPDSGDEIEDILPSFEMHNYMFNRTIYDTENIASLSHPPTYDELLSNNARNLHSVHLENTNDIHETLESFMNETNDQETLGPPPPLSTDPNNFVDPTANPNLLLLNNLDKVQKIDLPISIQIVLTKSLPKLGLKAERENPLRHYRPGEIVCGYALIRNNSNEPIPFEMELLSLEGDITIPNPHNPEETIKKKFLKTYDLSACFHYGCIDLQSQGVDENKLKDDLDHTVIGFDNDRIIKPNVVHKKMFSFKLPRYLLDTSCFDQLPSHLMLPPSIGLNREACSGLARLIKVNPLLGYGRLDRYGSPIKAVDYAVEGQSVSYSINVQFIGRKLDFYRKFYTHETRHEYDFISLKSIDYHFRVETSNCQDAPMVNNDYGEVSSAQQLKNIERSIADKLNEILKRQNLKSIGITDPRSQDEIIFSSLPPSKKSTPVQSAELIPTLSDTKTSITDDSGFTTRKTVSFTKDIFSKVEGDLTISMTMHRNARLKSMKPKQFYVKKNSSSNLKHLMNASETRLTPIFSGSSLSSLPLKAISSVRSSDSIRSLNSDKERLFVHLSFQGPHSKRGQSKVNLPSSITIAPSLKVFNIQSPFPIPLTFDSKLIFNRGLEKENVENLKKKFSFYYQQLLDVVKELDLGLARSIYNNVNGLSRMQVDQYTVKKFFEPINIDLNNQWKLNSNTNTYECEFQVPLNLDAKNMDKLSTLTLPPSFQLCYLGRLYAVETDVMVKKAKGKVSMQFPITVV